MTRRSIVVCGLGHGSSPIPTAGVVGRLLASGSVSGVDRSTGNVPPELAAQVRDLFGNVRAVTDLAMEELAYEPVYRTEAGTGAGLGFARWP